jgi:MFS family permease
MSNPKKSGNIVLLGLVSLLNDISSEVIQPVLPLFITALGGSSMAIGLIGGVSDGLPSIFKLLAGYWSDRAGRRKPLVVGGYGLSALAKLLLAFSASWQQVFLFKTVERCGKGIRSAPRDAMISESAAESRRGWGFGLHRSMDSAGAVIGSFLAYLLWQGGLDYRSILLVAGLLALLALIPFYRVRESHQSPPSSQILNLSGLSPRLRRFLAISVLFALGNFSYMFFILRAQSLFLGKEAVSLSLQLYILFNLVYAGLAMPIGVWSDRVGRKKVLSLGYALFALTALGFAFASTLAGLAVLFALYGLVFAMVDASERAFVSDLSDTRLRGSSLGVYYGLVGVAAIASSLIAGGLWTLYGPQSTFLFGAAAAASAALALLRMRT